jgi:hypothetical protein
LEEQEKTSPEETLMKNASVTMGLVALLLTSGVNAADVTILWQVTGQNIGSGYLPKTASDGLQNVVTIAATGEGLSAFEDQLGTYNVLSTPPSVSWVGSFSSLYSPPQTTPQIGLAPSIAMILEETGSYSENGIEVHQGGQENGSSLWYQLTTNSNRSKTINWLPSTQYDTGFNPTVAIDLDSTSTTATVVEVHQESAGESALMYHVGALTLGRSPSMSSNWGTGFEINGGLNQGSAPTVSIANNIAVLVAQGTAGTLWYSIGMLDTTTSTISWTDPIPYSTTGYNPAVSVYYWAGFINVVEAHQTDNGTGQLTYRTGRIKDGPYGSPGTSITWTPDTDTPYSTGCYPSVALAFYGYTPSSLSVTETHEAACDTVTTLTSSFGFLSK